MGFPFNAVLVAAHRQGGLQVGLGQFGAAAELYRLLAAPMAAYKRREAAWHCPGSCPPHRDGQVPMFSAEIHCRASSQEAKEGWAANMTAAAASASAPPDNSRCLAPQGENTLPYNQNR